jgi:hypothetical protein
VNALSPRLDLLLSVAVIIATGFTPAPANAQECHTVELNPQKHTNGSKFALAAAKWIGIKAEKDATVVVVETDSSSAVRVTSGCVTVRNLSDKSVVRLYAGCAYETVVRDDIMRRQPEAFLDTAAETIALFECKSNTSFLYRMDSKAKLKVEIFTPPLTQSYSIGDVAATRVPMPRMVSMHFPPTGVVVWHPPTPALAEQGKAQ